MTATIDIAGWTLVHFVWQGVLVGAASAAALRLMRSASPNARYAAACTALAVMLAAPIVTARLLMGTPSTAPVSAGSQHGAPNASPLQEGHRATVPAERPAETRALRLDPAGAPIDAWLPAIVAVWSVGVSVLFVRLLGGWWRIRRLHRLSCVSDASRWSAACSRIALFLGIRRAVHVADSAFVDTPLVVGWIKPVILLPIAALANLSPGQVDAILAHELAHIRRHDFLVNLLQTICETLLFYHPAVWWVSARIRTEREHCCDLIAVEVCGDPVSYAEALTELETWRTASTALAIAGTGGALVERVRRVLGVRGDDVRKPVGTATIAALLVLVLLVAGASQYLGAAQPVDPGASASAAGTPGGNPSEAVAWRMVFHHGPSELNMIGFTARELIRFAYQIPNSRILGGPSWLDEETFRIVVHLDEEPAADEMPSIVKRTLEERFGLRTHVERRDLPAHALVTARADGSPGPNVRPSTVDCFDLQAWIAAGQPPRELRPNAQRQPVCGEEAWDSTIARTSWVAITMPQFAAEMRGIARVSPGNMGMERRDVIDRTGLRGRYDIDLHAFLPAAALMARFPLFRFLLEPMGLPSMPAAIEQQLGLRLEDSTAPYDVIVIDSAEKPVL